MIADLHAHTHLSDGSMSIDDLIFYAKRSGLDFIAITDHDTMDGVTRASVLGKRHGISVVPGVEISCYDFGRERKAHLLCYFPQKPDRLQGLFTQVLEGRTRCGKKAIREIMRLYPVTEEHIARYTFGSKAIYKVHIMRAIIDLGYDIKLYGDIYRALFEVMGIYSGEIYYPDIYEALDTIHSAGGIAVLAHPLQYDSLELMGELAEKELIHGVEIYHPGTSEADSIEKLGRFAEKYGLLRTGGSDFHGCYAFRPQPLASRIATDEMINALFDKKDRLSKKGGRSIV